MSGRNLSAFLLTPPPTMMRSGENSASRYLEVRVETLRPLLPRQLFRLAHAVGGEALGVLLAHLEVAELGVGHQLAVEEHRAADAGAEGDHDHHAAARPCPRRTSISATPAASASLSTVTGAADRLAEELAGVGADPRRVDVRGGARDAVLDHRGERGAGGSFQSKKLATSPTTPATASGVAGWGVTIRCRSASSWPRVGVDRRALDAGAADVDAEHFASWRHSRSPDERQRAMAAATLTGNRGGATWSSSTSSSSVVVPRARTSPGRCIECGVEHRGRSSPSSSAASAPTGRASRARCCSGRARCWPRAPGTRRERGGHRRARRRRRARSAGTRSSATGTTRVRCEWLEGAGATLDPGPRVGWPASAGSTSPLRRSACAELEARMAVVLATGSSAVIPPIDGLGDIRIWDSRRRHQRQGTCPSGCVVLGGGVVGVEMAQAWKRLGAREVTSSKARAPRARTSSRSPATSCAPRSRRKASR